jgi:hypothetical protein
MHVCAYVFTCIHNKDDIQTVLWIWMHTHIHSCTYAHLTCTSFRYRVDIDRDKRNVAQGIRILPKGTVTFSIVLEGRFKGIVEKELRSQNNNKKGTFERREDRKELRGGVVAVPPLMDEAGEVIQKDEKLTFDGDDMEDSRGILPFVGDEIEFNVYIDKPTKKRKATGIKITAYGKAGREQGVVTKVKEGLSVSFLWTLNI